MMPVLLTIANAVVAFGATNVDDIVIVMLLFAHAGPKAHRQVVAGQYLGFAGLVLVSALGALGIMRIPAVWIGALGILPILVGFKKLLGARSAPRRAPTDEQGTSSLSEGLVSSPVDARALSIAAITAANGGDNIGVYIPLFADAGPLRMGITILVFFVLVGVLCHVSYKAVGHPAITLFIQRYGQTAAPIVLVGLGAWLIVRSGVAGHLYRLVIA